MRFKRSLAIRPQVEIRPKAKVAKVQVLNEGFAIPQLEIVPAGLEVLPEPSTRDGAEALPYARGTGQEAMAFAADPARCRQALLNDAMARTSSGPIESRLKKWETLAMRAGFASPFELTPDLIYTVMGAFKLAKYRSAEQYLETAKQAFIHDGGIWSDQLRQAARAAVRSCKRGIGCPKQAKGLPLSKLGNVGDMRPLANGGPVHPARATILASWWLLREIEASFSRVKHIAVSHEERKISWRLPSSKADWKALGAVRSHRCSCDFAEEDICPYHCMVAHLGDIGQDPDSPVFPGIDGRSATKAGWADTFQELARQLGLPLTHPNGARCWTGHSARATGAIHLAATCIDLWRIQIFGRWGSDAVLLYIRDGPVAQLDDLASESTAKLSIQAAQGQLKALLQQVESTKQSLSTSLAIPSMEMLTDCEVSPPPALGSHKAFAERFVRNKNIGGKIHTALHFMPDSHPREWRTKCAWRFALHETDYEFVDSPGKFSKCLKCFPGSKHKSSSSSDSSSSTSSAS